MARRLATDGVWRARVGAGIIARVRILIHGAGAVGGYFGALLARGGHEVVFVARGDNLTALRERGLTIRLADETLVLPGRAVAEPGEAPPADLILVCVKSYDTPAAAA